MRGVGTSDGDGDDCGVEVEFGRGVARDIAEAEGCKLIGVRPCHAGGGPLTTGTDPQPMHRAMMATTARSLT
jgi:hypothetical protein